MCDVEGEVCAGCLAHGPALRSSPDSLHYMRLLLADPQVPERALRVCWQCRAAVAGVRRFHRLVRGSQQALQRFWRECNTPSIEGAKPVLLNLTNRLSTSATLLCDTPGHFSAAPPKEAVPAAILKQHYPHPSQPAAPHYSIQVTPNVVSDVKSNDQKFRLDYLSMVHDSDQSDDEALSSVRLKKLIKTEKVDGCWSGSERNYSDGACGDAKIDIVKKKKTKNRKTLSRSTAKFKKVREGDSEHKLEEDIKPKKLKESGKSKKKGVKEEKLKGRQNDRFTKVVIGEEQMLAEREEERRGKWYSHAPHRCESCIIGYYSEQSLADHARLKHDQSNQFVCVVCAVRCGDARRLAAHAALHYRRLECRACGARHRAYRDMWRHHLRHHDPARTFLCALCGDTFPTRPSLVYHRRCEHRARCTCEHCGNTFRNQTTYKRHLLIHTGMPTFECGVCGRSYRGKFGLRTHAKTHGPPPRDAYCVECDVQFKHAFQYRRHLKISARHATDVPARGELAKKYACSACEKKFVSPSVLRRHHDSVHLKLKRHACDKCDKNYATPAALWTHRKTQHERAVRPRDKVCDVCGKGFRSNTTLVDHMRSHTGERPYSCDACAATFRHNSGLYMHKRLVHKMGKKRAPVEGGEVRTGGPLACGACPATFRHASGLYVHDRLEHKNGARRGERGAGGELGERGAGAEGGAGPAS